MDVLQREILAAFAKNGKKAEPGSKLEAWLQIWYQTCDATFARTRWPLDGDWWPAEKGVWPPWDRPLIDELP